MPSARPRSRPGAAPKVATPQGGGPPARRPSHGGDVAATYGAYAVELETDLAEAWAAPERWSERVRAAISALLAFGLR